MSFLQKMFGAGGKGDKGMPTTGQAIQKLRETEEKLIKKRKSLEKKIDQELDIAKKNGTKNKRGEKLIILLGCKCSSLNLHDFVVIVAIQALKRKKRYEKQLQQIDGTISTIEMQREALEGANTNTAVLQTMGDAAKALKAAHQHM